MKIVTYTNDFGQTIKALTLAEFCTLPDNWDEFVWQDQPSKEAAIARHNEALEAWRADVDASRPEKDTY